MVARSVMSATSRHLSRSVTSNTKLKALPTEIGGVIDQRVN